MNDDILPDSFWDNMKKQEQIEKIREDKKNKILESVFKRFINNAKLEYIKQGYTHDEALEKAKLDYLMNL